MSTVDCPVCQEQVTCVSKVGSFKIKCPRCGEYNITDTAFEDFGSIKLNVRQTANISGWLRENNGFKIGTYYFDNLRKIKSLTFHERADKILLALEKKTSYAGEFITRDTSWISLGWCINNNEVTEIIDYLKNSTRIVGERDTDTSKYGKKYKIAPYGWEHLERLKQINADSQQGFVAMWFDDSLQQIYDDVIDPAIYDAGYRPHRVDQREHNNKIDDEIIAEIRRSRFVLADFTGHRGGVYYEAGFAKGLGLEVFWTCREDEIEKLHFDIRQYNCIGWEPDKLEDFRKRITSRIESVIGRGTYQKKE